MGNPVVVGTDNFDVEVLQATRPVVVEFWTEGCQPCDRLSPILHQYQDDIKIAICNVDDYPDLTRQCGVMNVPTLMFYKNGELIDQAIGTVNDISESEVATKVRRVLSLS